MADARALLRAHRSENRIKHPHAAYSDAGKLLCKLCHEHIRSESLWDTHTRSTNHQSRLRAFQQQQQQQQHTNASDTNPSSKRKLDDVEDNDMEDDADGNGRGGQSPTKRSRTGQEGKAPGATREKTISPPLIGRRASNTPVQGVEIAIPSRPATPLARSDSATSTPNMTLAGRSPLVTIEGPAPGTNPSNANTRAPISTETLQVSSLPSRQGSVSSTMAQPPTPAAERTAPAPAVDESEWAAFEADLASADTEGNNDSLEATAAIGTGVNSTAYADATISAPAMTTAEVEAKSQEEINERRKQLLDAQIAGEKEDATRALEEEFDEMEELEGRVKRLKERREQLRKESMANLKSAVAAGADTGSGKGNSPTADGKENGIVIVEAAEDEDEDDEDDEWDGFRFRA